MSAQLATTPLQKHLGAFYTDEPVADRLVHWAITDGNESMLDPSCGDGVFLSAATSRFRFLGSLKPEVTGVDICGEALDAAKNRATGAKLIKSDFFDLTPYSFGRFDCIVGNPPFIRYQTFNGNRESLAHRRASDGGVPLPRLASSWAPFLVHAASFLKHGGRLAMVMPAELGHAMYARAVLRFLSMNFRHLAVEMFRENLFGYLSQSTVLLFCEGYGQQGHSAFVTVSERLNSSDRKTHRLKMLELQNTGFRFNHYLASEKSRHLYDALSRDSRAERLGEAADVGIGYVTGANDFFHLALNECRRWSLAKTFLRPCLTNLRDFEGVEFSRQDWIERRDRGEKVYLLALPRIPLEELPGSVRLYVARGEEGGLSARFKCRIRNFWYSMPRIHIPEAFLPYMSGGHPFIVANTANLVAPNTLHVLRFYGKRDPISYAISWRSSLTRLSCELEGHALGGGLFKLEPSEAARVLIVRPPEALVRQIKTQLHAKPSPSAEQVADIVDTYLLRRCLGVTRGECNELRDAALKIEAWRKHR